MKNSLTVNNKIKLQNVIIMNEEELKKTYLQKIDDTFQDVDKNNYFHKLTLQLLHIQTTWIGVVIKEYLREKETKGDKNYPAMFHYRQGLLYWQYEINREFESKQSVTNGIQMNIKYFN